jgi:phosphoribosylformimino-5-aminoimidazole carboxamide ribonucleotide (ProFAR) isomerase
MSLYENWMEKAFSQEGHSVEAVWAEYLPREQKIYEYILAEKVEKLEGTIAELAEKFDMNIIASGGVSSMEDVRRLTDMNIHGAIIGKAYYTGAVDLKEAIEVAK